MAVRDRMSLAGAAGASSFFFAATSLALVSFAIGPFGLPPAMSPDWPGRGPEASSRLDYECVLGLPGGEREFGAGHGGHRLRHARDRLASHGTLL